MESNKRVEFQVYGMSDQIAEAGLWALRKGLGLSYNQSVAPELSAEVGKAVVDWARKQTVSAVVWDGFFRDSIGDCGIHRELYLQWCAEVARIESLNERMNMCLKELIEQFQERNIAVLLLKGQGVGRFYPYPEHRQCGDIDLYVGEKEYGRAEELMEAIGERMHHSGEEKHSEFCFKGIVVEIHYIVTRFCNPSGNRKLKKLIAEYFPVRLCTVRLGKNSLEVPVFPSELDAFYQLTHIFHHLMDGGIGLRQLCDWCLLIHKEKETFDRSLFHSYVDRFHFRRIYGAVAYLSVHCLGLSPDELPLALRESDSRRGDYMLRLILSGGNFGKHRPRFSSLSGFALFASFRNYLSACRRSIYLFSFYPSETLWMPIQKARFYLKKQQR